MPNRLQKKPVAVYVPAVQAVPGRAAYCATSQVIVGYTQPNPGKGFFVVAVPPNPITLDPAGYASIYAPGGAAGYSGVQLPSSVLVPRYQTVKTCYPAVTAKPGSPARTDYFASAGWDAGARSIEQMPANGSFTCVLPLAPVAVQIGLTDRYFNHSYDYMAHSIVVRQSGYTIVERGRSITTEMPMSAGARLEIRRRARVVRFYLDDVLVHTSAQLSAGEVYAGALLYSLNDTVDDPAISAAQSVLSFSAAMPRLRGLISDAQRAYVDVEVPRLKLSAVLSQVRGVSSFNAVLPALKGLVSDRSLGLLSAHLPRHLLSANLSRPERVLSQVYGLTPKPLLSAQIRSGKIRSLSGQLPRLASVISDRQLALVNGSLPFRMRLIAAPSYMPPGEIDGEDAVVTADTSVLDTALLLLAIDSLDVSSSTADLVLVLELAGLDSLALGDAASFGSLIELLAIEQVAVSGSSAAARRQALQYAVNAATGALTTYEDFDFSGFVRVDGVSYGWRADGLYRIGQGDDNGALIQMLADFGTTDYGDTRAKRLESALLGVRSDGECYLRFSADSGDEQVYRLTPGDNMRRALLAKGVSGRHWSVKLDITDASYASVDSLEVAVGITQRHGLGRRN